MKISFVCPFYLDRLTGTPIRAKITINSASTDNQVAVIATSGVAFNDQVDLTVLGAGKLSHFTNQTLQVLKKQKPEVIHGFTTVAMIPALFYKYFFNLQTKVVFEMHGWTWYETAGQISWWRRLLLLLCDVLGYWLADAVIAMSLTQRDFLARKMGAKKRLAVIWGPVDFPISYEEPISGGELRVGYIGNNSWWQGLPELIKAATLVVKNNPRIQFELAGFDHHNVNAFPERPSLHYRGKVQRVDVPTFIKSCHVMISPRVSGAVSDLQYPQKLSEYIAAGRPVIGSDVNDQAKILTEAKCGFLVKPLTPESLAQKILEFYSLKSEQRTILGQNATTFADGEFSPSAFGLKLKQIYSQLRS